MRVYTLIWMGRWKYTMKYNGSVKSTGSSLCMKRLTSETLWSKCAQKDLRALSSPKRSGKNTLSQTPLGLQWRTINQAGLNLTKEILFCLFNCNGGFVFCDTIKYCFPLRYCILSRDAKSGLNSTDANLAPTNWNGMYWDYWKNQKRRFCPFILLIVIRVVKDWIFCSTVGCTCEN